MAEAKPPETVQRALALNAEGMPWRAVARELGLSDHSNLWRTCAPWAQAMRMDSRWAQLKSNAFSLAAETQAQTMEALLDGAYTPGQLMILNGIANDKAIAFVRAEQGAAQGKGEVGTLLEQLLGRLQSAGGGSASVTLEVTGAQAVTLDVESSE